MLGLLVVTFLTMLLAFAGVISWPLQIVVDVILVAFCIHLRAQAKRAVAVSRQRRRATVAPPAPRPMRRPAAPPAARPRPTPAAVTAERDEPLAATGTDDAGADGRSVEDTWEPVPVPRPTYTLKAPAPPEVPIDTIDPLRDTDPYNTLLVSDESLAAPGAEVIAAQSAQTDSGEVETDLDHILERRWAVND
jgi:hypothetical protein